MKNIKNISFFTVYVFTLFKKVTLLRFYGLPLGDRKAVNPKT